MKFARITLSAAAVVVSIVSAFAFTNANKGSFGTLYTIGGVNHVKCSRNLLGHNACVGNVYTKNHTLVTGAFSTGD